ncbi:hypothetical protein [Flavihumibacter sp. UBA7668]|uniref:hypothetical protein n=1 Tax=Flavihumibacter sp. UBA7668 TaxID=1946542 RepID=UPI0025BF9161|nr:hypothetical protein [Flavihumibacter sp. UBA7668]
MTVYEQSATTYKWAEQHLYGSSRLGIFKPAFEVVSSQPLGSDAYSDINDLLKDQRNGAVQLQDLFTPEELVTLLHRRKRYTALELRNWYPSAYWCIRRFIPLKWPRSA